MSAGRFPHHVTEARWPPHRPADANAIVAIGRQLGEGLDEGKVFFRGIQGPISGSMAPPPKKPFVVWAPSPWQLFVRRVRTYLGLR